MDSLRRFIVGKPSCTCTVSDVRADPIESRRGASIPSAKSTPQGLDLDRNWMTVDAGKLTPPSMGELPRIILDPQITANPSSPTERLLENPALVDVKRMIDEADPEAEEVGIERFRPSVVVNDTARDMKPEIEGQDDITAASPIAWSEDQWKRLRLRAAATSPDTRSVIGRHSFVGFY